MNLAMNTEKIFSTQALDNSLEDLFAEDEEEEIPSSQCFENDRNRSDLGLAFDDEILTQAESPRTFTNRKNPLPIPTKVLSVPSALRHVQYNSQEKEPLTQKSFYVKKFPVIVPRHLVKPPTKKLTEEQNQIREELRRCLVKPVAIDYSLYNPNEKFEKPKDDLPAELRNLMLAKQYVTAKEAHCIMSQSQTETQPNTARSRVEQIWADFEDIDGETLNEIDQHNILDNSLGSLTQKLNSSQRGAELIENSLSQTDSANLNVTKIDLEADLDAFPSDEEDDLFNKCTEEMEFDLFYGTEHIDLPVDLPEHSPPKFSKPQENESERPCCSKDLNQSFKRNSSSAMFSGASSSTVVKNLVKDGSKINEIPKISLLQQPPIAFSGFSFASGKSMKIDPAKINRFMKAFEQEDHEIMSKLEVEDEADIKTPVNVKTFKVPSSSTPISSRSSRLFTESSSSKHDLSTPQSDKQKDKSGLQSVSGIRSPMTGFASASRKICKFDENILKKFAANFEMEDKRFAQDLEDESKKDEFIKSPEKPKAKKIRLNFDEPSIRSKNMKDLFEKKQKPKTLLSRIKKSAKVMTDSQEVLSIVQLFESSSDMTQEYFKVPDSPTVSRSSPAPALKTSGSTEIKTVSSLAKLKTSSLTPESLNPQTRLNKQRAEDLLPEIKMPTIGFASARGRNFKMNEDLLKKYAERFEREDQLVTNSELEDAVNTSEKSKPKKLRLNFKEAPSESSNAISSINQFKKAKKPADQRINDSHEKMTDSQEVSSIIQLYMSMENMTEEFFKMPDSPSVSTKSVAFQTPVSLGSKTTDSPLAMPISGGSLSSTGKRNVRKIEKRMCHKLEEDLNDDLDDDGAFNLAFNTPDKPRLKKHRLNFEVEESPATSSPFIMTEFNKGINQHSTPLVKITAKLPPTDSQELSLVKELCESMDMCEDFQVVDRSPMKRKFAQVRLLNKFNESADSNSSIDLGEIDSIEQQYKSLYMIEDGVKLQRKRALEEQRKLVIDKAEGDRAQMTGTVFMKKSSKSRQRIIDYVENEPPKNLSRHQITIKNAIDYKFLMQNHVSEATCATNTDGIIVGDNARLILNEQSKVGVEEIKLSFLTSPGVDPKLLSEKWVENAYKMILVKLASLENSFEKFEKYELLSPENVLLQLKYRYDREIDRNQRSAIKKLVELDDIPYRRMVLKVVDVRNVPNLGYELILTDGWYTIRSSIDARLADAVDRQKVKVGTKLVTSCAELIGCAGCDPLDMPGSVSLKIHANSTRRINWDVKLGFIPNPTPIRVPLDSVLSSGGTIGKLMVVVIHVYQVIYVHSSDGKKEFRSEKLQRRIQNKQDIISFAAYEQVAYQVQNDEIASLRERVSELHVNRNELKNLSPEEICDLLEFETDADESMFIQNQVSQRTMHQVQNVREKRQSELNEKIKAKLGERDKSLSQLVRFRVVDAINPQKTAVVSWWSPTEELLETIKEGKAVEIINSVAAPYNKEIQITARKSSAAKVAKVSVAHDKLREYFRKETKISEINADFEPQHGEFDVGCVVIHIDQAVKDLYKVYVADEDTNILCINFWSSLASLALDDVVTEGKTLFVKNLQLRISHAANKIPQAFAISESTMFIPHPKNDRQRNRLTELNNAIQNETEFFTKCNNKIRGTINKENHRLVINNNSPLKQSKLKPLGRPDFSRTYSLPKTSQTPSNEEKNEPRKRKRLGSYGHRRQPNFNLSKTKSKTR